MRKKFDLEKFYELKNPGVPFVVFTNRANPTPVKLVWKGPLKPHIEKKEYFEPEEINGYGDGMVPSNSLFYGPLKWAFEFDKGLKGSKPVKIIDFCSDYNERYSIYDDQKGEF